MGQSQGSSWVCQWRSTEQYKTVPHHCPRMSQALTSTVATLAMLGCPAYGSLQALLRSNLPSQAAWLRYWVLLATVELLSLPMAYYKPSPSTMATLMVSKLVFLLWCQAPVESNGSDIILSQFIYLRAEFKKAFCSFMEDSEFEDGERITIKYSIKRKFRIFLLRLKMKLYELMDPN